MSTAGTGTTATGSTGQVNDPLVGQAAGYESSLSNWAGPYVTNMLGMGQALAQQPYQAYQGPLTAGTTQAQQQAFSGIAGLAVPTEQMGAYTPQSFTAEGTAQQYMSPYLQAALDPQLEEARRQATISRIADAGRLSKAGAFGGSRQAIMESEGQRNLLRNMADITGEGYQRAFEQAQAQFNTEQDRARQAQETLNRYGLDALRQQATMGAEERAIEQGAIDAAKRQFEEERLFPYKQVQFMQSLLQDLPLEAQQRSYIEPSQLSQFSGNLAAIESLIQQLIGGGGSGAVDDSGGAGGTGGTGGAAGGADPNQAFRDSIAEAVANGEIDQATADAILAGAGV